MESDTTPNYEIKDDLILKPLRLALDQVTPIPSKTQHQSDTKKIADSLQDLFPEQAYDEKDIKKVKEILGTLSNEFTESELKDIIAQFQYLAESWLDNFEKEVFDGITLNEVLHERGGV